MANVDDLYLYVYAHALFTSEHVASKHVDDVSLHTYVIVISRARGMYGIYCIEARGREAARGLSAINAIHPECT